MSKAKISTLVNHIKPSLKINSFPAQDIISLDLGLETVRYHNQVLEKYHHEIVKSKKPSEDIYLQGYSHMRSGMLAALKGYARQIHKLRNNKARINFYNCGNLIKYLKDNLEIPATGVMKFSSLIKDFNSIVTVRNAALYECKNALYYQALQKTRFIELYIRYQEFLEALGKYYSQWKESRDKKCRKKSTRNTSKKK